MTTAIALPELTAGTWAIDAGHSTVGFTVRHLVVSKVRGRFQAFTGTITVAEDGTPTVDAEIDVTSITTDNAQRDGHLKTADFFEVEKFPPRHSSPPRSRPTAETSSSPATSPSTASPTPST
ncbi:YceI family protein [Rhodococcus sp. AW25M09]|nr:YceI family protein [Rhodococcus sp. AW25M09]